MPAIYPSRVARTLARQFWPDVQQQSKLCDGAYRFSCAGHGGIIAHIDRIPDLQPRHVALARKHGLTELVISTRERGRTRTYTSRTHEREGLEALIGQPEVRVFELWVGEEDCTWATLALCSRSVRDGLGWSCSYLNAYGTVQRWHEQFLAELIGQSYRPLPAGQIRERQHIEQAQATGELFVSYAGGCQPAPDGHVVVGFDNRLTDAARRTAVYFIPTAVYDRRSAASFPLSVTLGWLQALSAEPFQPAELPHIATKRVAANDISSTYVLQPAAMREGDTVEPDIAY